MHEDREHQKHTRPKRRWIAWALAESAQLDIAMPWERDTRIHPEAGHDAPA